MPVVRLTCLLLAVPAALTAQDLATPEDWSWRLDGEQHLAVGQEVPDGSWRYVRMPPGWHITTTEQGVSLFPEAHTVEGRWGVEAELHLFPDPSDAPFGIVLEAADVRDGSAQLQFLMRRDGAASLLARRGGADTMMVAWQQDPEVTGHPGSEVVKYVLRVTHEREALAFTINGHEAFAMPTNGEDRRSVPGLRIGPGLNVHVSRFDLIEPLAPPGAR